MKKYLLTLLTEKGINLETMLEVEMPNSVFGNHFIPLLSIVDIISNFNPELQKKAKTTLVMIDFKNGDVMHFFKHIAFLSALKLTQQMNGEAA